MQMQTHIRRVFKKKKSAHKQSNKNEIADVITMCLHATIKFYSQMSQHKQMSTQRPEFSCVLQSMCREDMIAESRFFAFKQ